MSVETPCPERTHGAGLQVAKELAFGKAAGSGAVPQNEGCGTVANPEEIPGAPEGAPRFHPRAGGRESPEQGQVLAERKKAWLQK